MRRRIGISLIGMVAASLVLAGLGTIVLASVADRQSEEEELREQTDALRGLFREVTLVNRSDEDTAARGQRLARLSHTMSLEGIGILVAPNNDTGAIIGTYPPGVDADDIDFERVLAGEIVSGNKDGLIFAAGGVIGPSGLRTMVVLSRRPGPVVQPAFRWFIVAGLATIGVAVIVTIRLSRRLIEPIRQTSATATLIAGGDMSARVDERHAEMGGELADLVESVNTMAGNLERSRALERQFLLSVSHDLRTPLTNIRGYAEALVDGVADDPVAVGAILEAESRRLERLVGDLLLLARLEGTGFAYSVASHDLRLIIEDTTEGHRREAEQRGINLAMRMPDTPARAEVDHDRLGQVIANLVGNALKFADTSVEITLWYEAGKIHVAVADDGPGISESDLPHVFERLYVAQQHPKIKESGSGLGLAIVRELVEGMGGSVIARKATGGGAEFVASFNPSAQ